jgi:outer membrane receptor protein involved in Fe transport
VPGYTRVDARIEWSLRPSLSFSVTGQNLTDTRHIEFGGIENATTVTFDPRRVEGRLVWTF